MDNQALMLPPESSDAEIKELLQNLVDSLKPFEYELGMRGTRFFGGITNSYCKNVIETLSMNQIKIFILIRQ